MHDEWAQALRAARERLGLSRAEVARRSSLSAETVRAYEQGRRRPAAGSLTAILDALQLARGERNQIMVGAGFAPDGLQLRPQGAELMFTPEEAAQEVERYAWPAFVLDEFMQVLSANRVAQRLWGVDLRREFAGPAERNMLSVASNRRFAQRCLNWDEAIGVMISVFKGHHRGPQTFEQPSPYFEAVLQEFLKGDQRYVKRFLSLWDTTPPAKAKVRWTYPVVWEEPHIGRFRFQAFASSANEWDGLAFNDWIPLDGATWLALDALAERP